MSPVVVNIIAPVSALSRRTRLAKIATHLYRSGGREIRHYGWLRNSTEQGEIYLDFPTQTKYLVRGGGYGNKSTRLKYIVWMLRVFYQALILPRQSTIWALGFESAFPVAIASIAKKHKLIFDDADRFSLAFPIPRSLIPIVQKLEEWTSIRSDVHVIPGIARYDFQSAKFFELKNTPSEREIQKARELFSQKNWPKNTLVVNINGWLGQDRGIPVMLDVARQMTSDDIVFLIAGKPDCLAAKDLIMLPNVQYLGQLSNAEALASYFASDYVVTYYNPKLAINQLAESNKWGDAIMIGVGVIANKEVKTANFLEKVDAGIF